MTLLLSLQEGANNEKFSHHPRNSEALPVYLMVHNRCFPILDLAAALLLLLMGFFEKPCLPALVVSPQVHGAVELCTLALIAVLTGLRTRSMGLRNSMSHRRTLIKVSTLAVMLLEAVVVIVRADAHFRITRALRPIFLIDNHFCGGVRR